MSVKNKKTSLEKINDITQQAGMVIMAAAMTLSMAELHENPANRLVLPNQPALEVIGAHDGANHNEPIRREREETSPHHISYGNNQRTPSRAGRA